MKPNCVYMSVHITTYSYPHWKPYCKFFQQIDGEPMTSRTITLDEARRLMWELKLAGGYKTMHVNMFDSKISYRNVQYWARR